MCVCVAFHKSGNLFNVTSTEKRHMIETAVFGPARNESLCQNTNNKTEREKMSRKRQKKIQKTTNDPYLPIEKRFVPINGIGL